MIKHNAFCPDCFKLTPHTNHDCDICRRKRLDEEERRWQSLTLEQRIEELRKRINVVEIMGRPLR